MRKPFRVLGIESSCDETAVALLEFHASRFRLQVLKNLVTSQIPIHQKYGGVVPEVAARSHVPETVSLLSQVLQIPNSLQPPLSKIEGWRELFDVVAVTRGPGLATALRVGLEAGRVLAFLSKKPLIGVNHLEGHLASAWLNAENRKRWKFPLLALIVSGGHTELVLMKNFCKYKIIGQTRDDAAGECFDKSAKLMGLPYPGGPQIAKLAESGNPTAFDFPRPMLNDKTLDFSFSGLKTAVRNEWERLNSSVIPAKAGIQPGSKKVDPRVSSARWRIRPRMTKKDFAASLQQAIVDVLVEKTIRGIKKHKVNGLLLVGGVSANKELRRQMQERLAKDFPRVAFLPSDLAYITDNAAMIAAAGYWRWQKSDTQDWKKIDVRPEWNL